MTVGPREATPDGVLSPGMGVLQSPITWIVVAAVLVLIAILLLVVSATRRRRARRAAAAAAWPPPALEASRPNPDAPWTGPVPTEERVERIRVTTRTPVSNATARADAASARYADPDTAPLDVDTIRARLAAELAEPAPPVEDDVPAPDAEPPHRPRHAVGGAETEDETGEAPAPRPESAKDRLLGVLLRDPQAAIAALDATGHDGDAAPGEGHVTALLRAGLSPAQVARLTGVDEAGLATVVARSLGLLPAQGGSVTTGENRTDDPGRSWANAASPAGSTTPTTG